MFRRVIPYLLGLLALLGLLVSTIGCGTPGAELLQPEERLRVATTTSLYDTGLWGHLEPIFEDKYDVELDILYAGTGIALEYGKRGGVDVTTIPARGREL